MAGSLIDNLRGARETSELPTLEEPTPPLGALLGLLTALAFLESGGASRVAAALVSLPAPGTSVLLAAAHDLTRYLSRCGAQKCRRAGEHRSGHLKGPCESVGGAGRSNDRFDEGRSGIGLRETDRCCFSKSLERISA